MKGTTLSLNTKSNNGATEVNFFNTLIAYTVSAVSFGQSYKNIYEIFNLICASILKAKKIYS